MNVEQLNRPADYSFSATDNAEYCQAQLVAEQLDGEFFVNVATDHTIQLDFDIPFDQPLPQQFTWVLEECFARILINDRTAHYRHLKSRSGNTHVVISLSWDMPQAERIAWQAAMGSDFKREALSLTYAALGQRSPVLLYSRKEEVAIYVPIHPVVVR